MNDKLKDQYNSEFSAEDRGLLHYIEWLENKLSHPSDNTELIEAAKHLLHLHACEMEGIESGQPTKLQWLSAVNKLEQALEGETK